MSARWSRAVLSPDASHHIVDGAPLYARRWVRVGKFHRPGLAPARDGGGALHIDASGEPAYSARFVQAFGFYEGLAAVEASDGWHHIRVDGTPAYASRWTWCGNLQEGRVPVRGTDGRYRHLDVAGDPVGRSWAYAGDFKDGVAVVQGDDGRSTHVDRAGERIHGRWFRDLDVFHKGWARARDEQGWTHVDRSGVATNERRFAMVEPFYNGQARVERFDGGLEVIDETGRTLVELRPGLRDGSSPSSPERVRSQPSRGGPASAGTGAFVLPEPTLAALASAPSDRPTLLLLRHSVRGPLPHGEAGNDVPLLPEGWALARALGRHVGRRLVSLHTSPLPRCLETAQALAEGAGVPVPLVEDTHLGHPGVYVVDGDVAWRTWRSLGHEQVVARLVAGDRLDGLADPALASRRLVDHLRTCAAGRAGVHIFVTHDSLVTAAAAHTVRQRIGTADWPWYLEALAIVDHGARLVATYRTWSVEIEWA